MVAGNQNTNMTVSGKVSAILAHKQATTVWSIGPNAMLIDAIQLMDEKNVGALPVCGEWDVNRNCFPSAITHEKSS